MKLAIQSNIPQELDPTFDVSLAGFQARKEALELTAGITTVTNDAELADCIAAAGLTRELVDGIKDAYDEAKAPLLLATRRLDNIRHGFADALVLEQKRLNAIAGAYVTSRDDAARKAADAAARALREREEAAAEAGASADEIRELVLARQEIPSVSSGVAGARTATRWDYEVLDIGELWKARPDLVKVEPRRAAILSAISAGGGVAGLRIFQTTNVSAQ